MAKVKCKQCGAECCSCNGCNTKAYINGVCPTCQKINNNVNSENTGMSGVRESESSTQTSGVQYSEPTP